MTAKTNKPLTHDGRYDDNTPFYKVMWDEKDVLSALRGLKEDLCSEPMPCEINFKLMKMVDKWFVLKVEE